MLKLSKPLDVNSGIKCKCDISPEKFEFVVRNSCLGVPYLTSENSGNIELQFRVGPLPCDQLTLPCDSVSRSPFTVIQANCVPVVPTLNTMN